MKTHQKIIFSTLSVFAILFASLLANGKGGGNPFDGTGLPFVVSGLPGSKVFFEYIDDMAVVDASKLNEKSIIVVAPCNSRPQDWVNSGDIPITKGACSFDLLPKETTSPENQDLKNQFGCNQGNNLGATNPNFLSQGEDACVFIGRCGSRSEVAGRSYSSYIIAASGSDANCRAVGRAQSGASTQSNQQKSQAALKDLLCSSPSSSSSQDASVVSLNKQGLYATDSGKTQYYMTKSEYGTMYWKKENGVEINISEKEYYKKSGELPLEPPPPKTVAPKVDDELPLEPLPPKKKSDNPMADVTCSGPGCDRVNAISQIFAMGSQTDQTLKGQVQAWQAAVSNPGLMGNTGSLPMPGGLAGVILAKLLSIYEPKVAFNKLAALVNPNPMSDSGVGINGCDGSLTGSSVSAFDAVGSSVFGRDCATMSGRGEGSEGKCSQVAGVLPFQNFLPPHLRAPKPLTVRPVGPGPRTSPTVTMPRVNLPKINLDTIPQKKKGRWDR